MTRRAIVTGASSGIGHATSVLLAAAGIEVVLAARRAESLKAIADEIGPLARPFPFDITDPAACLDLVSFSRSLGEAEPILVNNAGIAEFGDFASMPIEALDRQLAVNLIGPMHLTHAWVPWALEAKAGQLINVLSVTAVQVFGGSAGYSSAKAGFHMLGRILSAEYRRKGLRVTNILPGAVDTPIWEGQAFVPKRQDMLPVQAVAEAIRDVVLLPADRSMDEIFLMPPKGVL